MKKWMFGDNSGIKREDWEVGPFAQAFPANYDEFKEMELTDIEYWSKKKSPFGSAGYAWINRSANNGPTIKTIRTFKAIPIKEESRTIEDIMIQKNNANYDESYEAVSYTHLTLPTTPYV